MVVIKNDKLTVEINELGAELMSVKGEDGTEYLWQGDKKYWGGRSPILFPYVGRFMNGEYTFDGKTYKMNIHGFARRSVFSVNKVSDEQAVLTISSNDETKEVYPFDFEFSVDYKLDGAKLYMTFNVVNKNNYTMYFGVGGHPGINVPFEKGTDFEDYYLDFGDAKSLKKVELSENCLTTDIRTEYMLDGGKINLKHSLFDNDAIIFENAPKTVAIKSKKTGKAVRATYNDMDYIAFWHATKTDAPYVCIEPWSSLPSRQDVVEDFATQPSLLSVEAGGTYKNELCFEIME